MPLLFDDDYRILTEAGIEYEEDEANRFLILKAFPLAEGLYVAQDKPVNCVDVLYVVPPLYNSQGGDMFWVNPEISRADGQPIPQVSPSGSNQDPRFFKGVEFCRWSRHWNKVPWKPKEDNIQTILSRIEWALKNPDPKKS